MDNPDTLQSLGFTLPTPAYLVGVVLFGIIGFAAYRYGKKAALPIPKWLGIALMLYPYAIPRDVAAVSGACRAVRRSVCVRR